MIVHLLAYNKSNVLHYQLFSVIVYNTSLSWVSVLFISTKLLFRNEMPLSSHNRLYIAKRLCHGKAFYLSILGYCLGMKCPFLHIINYIILIVKHCLHI